MADVLVQSRKVCISIVFYLDFFKNRKAELPFFNSHGLSCEELQLRERNFIILAP